MIITKLRLSNFGPYLGDNEIEFGNSGKGLHIFRGGTGQGKTSLQNSIIWALYGIIENRKGREIPPTSILNRQARNNGIYSFGVQLYFIHNDKPWILTRRMSSKIHSDRSYKEKEKFNLICDGEVIPNPKYEIERILPNSINRFFFFDGEMLRDYEELLEEKSTKKQILKDSIERILGIPFYRLARNDLNSVLSKVERERSQLVRRLSGEDFKDLQAHYDFIVEEITRINNLITSLEEQISDLEYEITINKRKQEDYKEIKEYAIRRNDLDQKIIILKREIDLLDEEIKKLNINLYKTILSSVSENIISVLEKEHKEKMEKYDNKKMLEGELRFIKNAKLQTKCRLCGNIFEPEKLNELERKEEELIEKIKNMTEIPEPNTQFENYILTLNRMSENMTDQKMYQKIVSKKSEIEYEIAKLNQELEEIKPKLVDQNVQETLELDDKIHDLIDEKGRLEGILSTQNIELLNLKEIKSELDQKISSIDEKELNILDKRIKYIKSLSNIFEEAILLYTEARKSNVETEATNIFRELRSKIDFDRLKINENYGLSIVTTNGDLLDKSEWRSAGEEQLVAISLIGALNKCSQITAPISMDAPFIRLDLKHGSRVMSYLPKLSDQIIIFATDREIRDDDLKMVSEIINSDYTLEHVSESIGTKVRHTRR